MCSLFVFSVAGKMVKLYPFTAGNTLEAHKKCLKKLKSKGAKVVKSIEKSDAIIVFFPVASRYETDVTAALNTVPGKGAEKQERRAVFARAVTHSMNLVFCLCRHRTEKKGGAGGHASHVRHKLHVAELQTDEC